MDTRPQLIAIVGPTASGKTGLALEVAERWNGEIICADSRTVYKGMDVGTAKPSREEQARIRHWGLDLVEPGQPFSAADFKRYADEAIMDIRSRGKLPLLVGGTGLYTESVLYDYQFGQRANDTRRQELEVMTLEELQNYCKSNNIQVPENDRNKRYLVRAIEQDGINHNRNHQLAQGDYIIGIATSTPQLRTRIAERTEHLFANGVEKEATMLGEKYGWDSEAMTGNIYPLLRSYLQGELSLADVKERFITSDYRLAKRQMTWLRRNPHIMWCSLTEAEGYITSLFAPE